MQNFVNFLHTLLIKLCWCDIKIHVKPSTKCKMRLISLMNVYLLLLYDASFGACTAEIRIFTGREKFYT